MMRSKEEILRDSLEAEKKDPTWDSPMLKNEQLTIEVLIDIRDLLSQLILAESKATRWPTHGG